MAGAGMTTTAGTTAAAASAAIATTADISPATAAVITVAVAAVVVVAAAAERAADDAGDDAANDRLGNSRVISIVDLLDGGVGPNCLRSHRIDRCGQGGRGYEHHSRADDCYNSNTVHLMVPFL